MLTLLQMPDPSLGSDMLVTVSQILNTLQKGIVNDITIVGRSFALVGVVITLLIDYNKRMLEKEPLDLKRIYPLAFIALALVFYGQITYALDNIGIYMQTVTNKTMQSASSNNYTQKIETTISTMRKKGGLDTTGTATTFSKSLQTGDKISESASIFNIGKWFSNLVIGLIIGTMLIVISAVGMIYNLMFTLKKLILQLFGPFSIGISTIPVYRNSAMNWINAYFLTVIAQVISNLFLNFFQAFTDTIWSKSPSDYSIVGVAGLCLFMIMMAAAFIYLISKSEMLAGKLMSLNTNNTASELAGNTFNAVTSMVKGAASKIGG